MWDKNIDRKSNYTLSAEYDKYDSAEQNSDSKLFPWLYIIPAFLLLLYVGNVYMAGQRLRATYNELVNSGVSPKVWLERRNQLAAAQRIGEGGGYGGGGFGKALMMGMGLQIGPDIVKSIVG